MNRKQLDEVDGFKNRITGSGLVRAAELIENPLNARRHSKEQATVMHGALNELGWIQEVIVNQRTGRLIDGHLRLSLALRQGNDTPVPVKYVDLDENEERLALLTLDPISAMAETDNAALEALLQDVNTGEAALQEFLAKQVEVIENVESEPSNEDAFQEIADEFSSAFALKTDMAFPSQQPFGIPDLRDDRLFEIPDEVLLWPGDDLRDSVGSGLKILNYSTSCQTLDFTEAVMSFYTDDLRFEHVWTYPDKMATRLLNAAFQGVISPNFSLWPGQAAAVHIFNVYRSRWVARYFQEAGLMLLPDVNWADRADFAFCFAGIPQGCHISIQVQTFNPRKADEVEMVRAGIIEAIRVIKPERVLFYASKAGRDLLADLSLSVSSIVLPTLMDLRRGKLKK